MRRFEWYTPIQSLTIHIQVRNMDSVLTNAGQGWLGQLISGSPIPTFWQIYYGQPSNPNSCRPADDHIMNIYSAYIGS